MIKLKFRRHNISFVDHLAWLGLKVKRIFVDKINFNLPTPRRKNDIKYTNRILK